MFANTVGGLSVIQLQYLVSFLALGIFLTLQFGIYHWASLVTNKNLLQKLIFMVLMYGTFQLIMAVYCTITFFISFKGVDWEVSCHMYMKSTDYFSLEVTVCYCTLLYQLLCFINF